jgi:SAM-dependent methyltransferase
MSLEACGIMLLGKLLKNEGKWKYLMNNLSEGSIAEKYGAYSSFKTSSAPYLVDYFGENPMDEIDRLLSVYISPQSKVLDVGCGAGHTMVKISSKVNEFWGIDLNEELLTVARDKAKDLNLNNVTLISGDTTNAAATDKLPDDYFDIAFSQRGPNMNYALAGKLKNEGFFFQELVAGFDCYPLKEIFGRKNYSPYNYNEREVILNQYANLELFPVAVKEYFYEEYFHDINHFEAYLRQGANLDNWRIGSRPYNSETDRTSLELYAKYNTTPKGIKLLHQRMIFVLRKTKVSYYPIDSI